MKLDLLARLVRALTSGDPDACFYVGEALCTGQHFGVSVTQDLPRAAHFYGIAARQGYRDAQYELGFMYLQGEGVDVDLEEGLRLMTAAAEQHHYCDAMRILVDAYGRGVFGVQSNEALAKHWRARLQAQRKRDAEED